MRVAYSIFLLGSVVNGFSPSLKTGDRFFALFAKPKVFIDGEAGTTGLQVRNRLESRDDLEIISPPSDLRKDPETRRKFINEADAVILCLPDDASKEAASWVDNDRTVLIDASTAFRVADDWTYGFPGMYWNRRFLGKSYLYSGWRSFRWGISNNLIYFQRHQNYARSSVKLWKKAKEFLIQGATPPDSSVWLAHWPMLESFPKARLWQWTLFRDIQEVAKVSCKFLKAVNMSLGEHMDFLWVSCSMVALFPWTNGNFPNNQAANSPKLTPPGHKHIPEMAKYSGLGRAPIFQPQIADFAQGMVVNVPIHYDWLAEGTTGEKIHATLKKHYEGSKFVEVMPLGETGVKEAGLLERGAFLRPDTLANTNKMQLFVFANDAAQQVVLSARLDNLGKGASGAAVQNLNIALGLDEAASL